MSRTARVHWTQFKNRGTDQVLIIDYDGYTGTYPAHATRNQQILALRQQGWRFESIADRMQLTRQRVHQIFREID